MNVLRTMRTTLKPLVTTTLVGAFLGAMLIAPGAQAVHLYRSTDGGCSEAAGALTDDTGESGALGTTVFVGHNTFNDASNGTPVTRIEAGESVTWEWTSAHCHSVTGPDFNSGFLYPTEAPESPQVNGAFEYPVLDFTPALSYTHTFTTPGTYSYSCVHHGLIGMVGTVIVS